MGNGKQFRKVLSIDLGTSRVKVVIASENGDILARTAQTYPIDIRTGGIVEQSPEDWLSAINNCTKELASKGNKVWPPDICSITGQMHGIVLLAKDGSLLRKVITWADFRAIEEITEIESYLSQET
ncbi:MAG: xylulokinase, partial [Actinobacteria bacterium]|nr:xylulokinase [Actinomycetota bacterium]